MHLHTQYIVPIASYNQSSLVQLVTCSWKQWGPGNGADYLFIIKSLCW